MILNYLTLGFILFILGVLGIIVNRKNIIILLMCIELMLLSINFMLLSVSTFIDDLIGHIFALYILVVAAAESAIGLSMLVIWCTYKTHIYTCMYVLRFIDIY